MNDDKKGYWELWGMMFRNVNSPKEIIVVQNQVPSNRII